MIKAWFQIDMPRGTWNIYVTEYDTTTHRVTHEGRPVVMEKVANVGMVTDPTFSLGREEIQELMDDMWRAGIRPSSTSSAADLVDAKDKHIGDLSAFMHILLKKVKIR